MENVTIADVQRWIGRGKKYGVMETSDGTCDEFHGL